MSQSTARTSCWAVLPSEQGVRNGMVCEKDQDDSFEATNIVPEEVPSAKSDWEVRGRAEDDQNVVPTTLDRSRIETSLM